MNCFRHGHYRNLAFLVAWTIALPLLGQGPAPDLQPLIRQVMPSIATIRVQDRDGRQLGIGTGFVVDPRGLIATNYHVLAEGRDFTVELWPRKMLKVLAVEATDVAGDYALVRVEPPDNGPLPALELARHDEIKQGLSVVAFGHPLGLEHSVVQGIISAVRELDGARVLQLAMAIEPGNSGGPVVSQDGRVLGVVNIKALRAENLGFAVPITGIQALMENPNPIALERWVHSPTIDEERWRIVFGANWQERSGIVSARGLGTSFGERSLCLWNENPPNVPFELSVHVKLSDERGAAGLVFHSDGSDRHYGFYPSNGKLRLTCFQGPSVESWEILQEVSSRHYQRETWNELKVHVDHHHLKCFVNGHEVIAEPQIKLRAGKVGLAKFRDTAAEFKRFRIGQIGHPQPNDTRQVTNLETWLSELEDMSNILGDRFSDVARSPNSLADDLLGRARALQAKVKTLERLAEDVRAIPTLEQLRLQLESEEPVDLFRGALWIAALDNPELDIDTYVRKVGRMAAQITKDLDEQASHDQRVQALHRFLFEENGYHGCRHEYYHVANSYLDRVIDDREGLPITLSILYMELARRIGIAVEGVGLPGHFVVRCGEGPDAWPLIDVFEKGKRVSKTEADRRIIESSGRQSVEDDFRAQRPREILARVLRNLIGMAQRNRDDEAMVRYCSALVVLDSANSQYRWMRAVARYRSGRLAGALSDVQWLRNARSSDIPPTDLKRLEEAIQAERDLNPQGGPNY